MATRPPNQPYCQLCGDWKRGAHDPKLENSTDLETGREVVYCYLCRKGQAEIAAANTARLKELEAKQPCPKPRPAEPASTFRKGTHGWVLDMNRREIRKMRQHLSALQLGSGSMFRDSAEQLLDAISKSMALDITEQGRLHPGDLDGDGEGANHG